MLQQYCLQFKGCCFLDTFWGIGGMWVLLTKGHGKHLAIEPFVFLADNTQWHALQFAISTKAPHGWWILFCFPTSSTRSPLRSLDNVGSGLYSLISIEIGWDQVCSLMSIRGTIIIVVVASNTSLRFWDMTEEQGIYTAIVRNWCNTRDIVGIIQFRSNRCRDGFSDSTVVFTHEILCWNPTRSLLQEVPITKHRPSDLLP